MVTGLPTFVPSSVALRAPRLVILVPPRRWNFHVQNALKFLSNTWGGLGAVVLPLGRGHALDPALRRLLALYDPDYLAPIGVTIADYESVAPGELSLRVDGKVVRKTKRAAMLSDPSFAGQMMNPWMSTTDIENFDARLSVFAGQYDSLRVHTVHPSKQPYLPLSQTPIERKVYTPVGSTGSQLLDLSIHASTGLGDTGNDLPNDLGKTSTYELWRNLFSSSTDHWGGEAVPFTRTSHQLVHISDGYPRRRDLVVVFGSTPRDFALWMLIDRIMGRAVWAPIDKRHKRFLPWLMSELNHEMHGRGDEIVVTSLSQSEEQVRELVNSAWSSRPAIPVPDVQPSVHFVPAESIELDSRLAWKVKDQWDQRLAFPIRSGADEEAEMLIPAPVLHDDALLQKGLHWIVDVSVRDRPVPRRAALRGTPLLAADQNEHETFVRPCRGSISFESRRWDWIPAGPSVAGQVAQPKLRWPSLPSMMTTIVEPRGYRIQLSSAGRRGQIAARLWGGGTNL